MTVSVTRFVLAGLIVKVLLMVGVGVYVAYAEVEPIDFSTPANILAIGAGMLWYCKAVNRPMQKGEILRFALGSIIADLALSVCWFLFVTWLSDQPLSLQGVDAAVFDGSGILLNQDDLIGLLIVISFALLMTFFMAAFFAWLMTRKLPREETES